MTEKPLVISELYVHCHFQVVTLPQRFDIVIMRNRRWHEREFGVPPWSLLTPFLASRGPKHPGTIAARLTPIRKREVKQIGRDP